MQNFREPVIYSDEIYEKNLEKFSLYDPLTAIKFSMCDFSEYEYCYTHLGELNLYRKVHENDIYYHDMSGAFEEAKEWYRSKDLSNHKVVFLFGLGLGYYYKALKLWLDKSPHNRLIFLEDELGVIHRFLETSLATEILDNPQVIIHYLDIYPSINPQVTIHKSIDHLLKGYIRYNSFLGSTKLYTKWKESICFFIRDVIFYVSSWYLVASNETLAKKSGILTNHYYNILRQYRASNGHSFKQLFKGVPAIICGAGPSITSQIEELKKVNGEAVIFGSGTGMNVLNYYGIIPHFGVGLDPTSSQGTRIRTNSAYEVPYFYRPRFQWNSFDLHHGPKLYIQGYPNSQLSGWFDEELGLELEEIPNQGISSTNFSMQIARLMGCDPIILLGVDLAYVDSSRYPPIISAHPTDSRSDKEEISKQSEVPVYGKSNAGTDTVTKIEWFEEAKTVRFFKTTSPELTVISCSEQGLAIKGVEYMSFSDAVDKHLQNHYDIRNRIHAQTVKSKPCVDKETGLEKIKEWNASLHKCNEYYREIDEELGALWNGCQKGEALGVPPYTGKIALLESDLKDEPASKDQMVEYIGIVDDMALDKKIRYQCYMEEIPEPYKNLQQIEVDINYITFFQNHLSYRDKHLKEMIDKFIEEDSELSSDHHEGVKHTSEVNLDEGSYSLKDGLLVIDDAEMNIKLSVPFTPQIIPEDQINLEKNEEYVKEIYLEYEGKKDGQCLRYTPEGILESEMFYHRGKLNGPSTHFHENGDILARSWYIDGKREGKTWQWYTSGDLYSLQRFRNGVWDGVQEYFYDNGFLKSSQSYLDGILDGEVRLYYENGRLKRELYYVKGKLDGVERYYSYGGQLIWEANYSEGTPVDLARVWHSNGKLCRQYEYSDDHTRYVMREWDSHGNLIGKEVNLLENLQQINERRQKDLKKAIDKFDKDLMHLQYLTKQERSVFIY